MREPCRLCLSVCLVLLAVAAGLRARVAQPLFSFGVMADIQYRDADPQGTRFYRDSPAKLRQAVDHLNTLDLRFTIQLGDLIDGTFGSYDTVLPLFNALRTEHYHVLGNHDFAVEPVEKGQVLHRLGLDTLGIGRGYYDFSCGRWRFVVLNGNDLSVMAYAPGSAPRLASERYLDGLKAKGLANAQEWNGGIGAAQVEWLKQTLTRASRARERVVVFCHFPILPSGSATLWNAAEVLAVLRAHPAVAACFSGHAHEGGYVTDSGIHYLTFQGMVEGDRPAYAVVDVLPDALRITGFGRETSRMLPLGSR